MHNLSNAPSRVPPACAVSALVRYTFSHRTDLQHRMIWTDLEWQPKGTTGDGKCTEASRCQQGSYREDTGSFRHNHTLGQESQNEVGGKGRVAYKASVPQGLHEELLSLVMQQLE